MYSTKLSLRFELFGFVVIERGNEHMPMGIRDTETCVSRLMLLESWSLVVANGAISTCQASLKIKLPGTQPWILSTGN